MSPCPHLFVLVSAGIELVFFLADTELRFGFRVRVTWIAH